MSDESSESVRFSTEFVAKLIKKSLKDSSTTKLLTKDTSTEICAELLRVFAVEACTRASNQAVSEGSSLCDVEHVEKILPQLLLDF